MHEITYTRRARRDLESISDYLHKHSRAAAQDVITTIEEKIARLADFALMAPATDEPNVRELTIMRHPYKVYYRITGEEIRILHIRDARRAPWKGKS